MATRLKALAATVCIALGGAAAVQVLATPSGQSAAGFKPGSLTGKWSGKWKNTTFGSTGSIRATVRRSKRTLRPTIQFGGNVFGCQSPPPAIFELKKGKGKNRYNANGFTVARKTEAFGTVRGKYAHRKRNKLTGSGKDVACRPGLTWKLRGKLTSKRFKATVNITLPDGSKAKAKLSAKKL